MKLKELLNVCCINNAKFAKRLGVTKSALCQWDSRGVPKNREQMITQELKDIATVIINNA